MCYAISSVVKFLLNIADYDQRWFTSIMVAPTAQGNSSPKLPYSSSKCLGLQYISQKHERVMTPVEIKGEGQLVWVGDLARPSETILIWPRNVTKFPCSHMHIEYGTSITLIWLLWERERNSLLLMALTFVPIDTKSVSLVNSNATMYSRLSHDYNCVSSHWNRLLVMVKR